LIQDIVKPFDVKAKNVTDNDEEAYDLAWVIDLADRASAILRDDESVPVLVVCACAFMKVVMKNMSEELIRTRI
jgi:hypothetical protein